MDHLGFATRAVAVFAGLSLFAGCGGSQNAISPSAVTLQRSVKIASSGTLLYATGGCGGACVLSYPDGKLVNSISIPNEVGGECSNSSGDVFVTNRAQVLEYEHGGTSPVASLSLPGDYASGCSIDSTTGNLAVVFSGTGANIAIFRNASGSATTYETHIISFYCGYDNSGNLYVSGTSEAKPALAELSSGTSDFSTLTLSSKVGAPGQIQWDGTYMTYEGRDKQHIIISRLKTSGSTATVVGTTRIKGAVNVYQSWIYGNRVIVPYATGGQKVNKISVWAYPQGGKPVTKFGRFGQSKYSQFAGVVLSLAPN